jgi:uncharacterized protein
MKIVGTGAVRAGAEEVWAALRDPAVLSRAIPGCDTFEVTGPGLARFTATTAMTAISGTYSGTVSLADAQPPSVMTAAVSVAGDQGTGGTLSADLTVRLSPDDGGGTSVSFEAIGVAGGPIEGVGTRLLASAAKRLATDFLGTVDAALAERRQAPPGSDAQPGRSADQVAAAVLPVVTSNFAADPSPAQTDPAAGTDVRIVVAGVAIGLAGVIVGVLLGRGLRRAPRA